MNMGPHHSELDKATAFDYKDILVSITCMISCGSPTVCLNESCPVQGSVWSSALSLGLLVHHPVVTQCYCLFCLSHTSSVNMSPVYKAGSSVNQWLRGLPLLPLHFGRQLRSCPLCRLQRPGGKYNYIIFKLQHIVGILKLIPVQF